jgi:hypothetical protein
MEPVFYHLKQKTFLRFLSQWRCLKRMPGERPVPESAWGKGFGNKAFHYPGHPIERKAKARNKMRTVYATGCSRELSLNHRLKNQSPS